MRCEYSVLRGREKSMLRRSVSYFLGMILSAMFGVIAANAQSERILHTFTSNNDGATPQAGLIADANGNLYGTTVYGGYLEDCKINEQPVGCGTVFEMNPPSAPGEGWKETVIHEFDGTSNGTSPQGPILVDQQGNLYGTASSSGEVNGGIIYQLSPPQVQGGAWIYSVIAPFIAGGENLVGPNGSLALDSRGNLYGAADAGGSNCGGVFELSPSNGVWTITSLYSFDPSRGDGCYAENGVLMDKTGRLYGVTSEGPGGTIDGALFVLSLSHDGRWTARNLHTFQGGVDGSNPLGNLIINRGALYGTTQYGGDSGCGDYGCGTIYQISADGNYKIIYRFQEGTLNGIRPWSGLSADSLGNLYGTTLLGGIDTECPYVGTQGCGTVYELTPPEIQGGKWTETMLYAFTGFNGDGALPIGNVLWSSKGVLYGTASEGGNDNCSTFGTVGCGTVFALTK